MASLTTAQRKSLPKSDFVFPAKAPGSGSFPINDRKRAKAALSYARDASDPAKVRAAVHRKFPSIGKRDASKSVSLSSMVE